MNFRRFTPYVLLAPIGILYLVFIGGGILNTGKESLGYIPALGLYELNLDGYAEIILAKGFLVNLGFSVYLAFVATLVATTFGILIAYCFVTSKSRVTRMIVKKVLQTGLIIPYLFVILLALLMLNQSGFYSRLLLQLGVISEMSQFPELTFDRMGLGIIWVYVFKGIPFISIFVLTVMSKVSVTYENVAKTMGASQLTVLRKIYIPLCSGSIIWSSSILFAYVLGSFEVPYLLGSIYPISLSSSLYSLFISPDLNRIPEAMALNIIILFLGLVLVGLYAGSIHLLIKRRLR
jgi:putative spermidine/putrescine transport system permease protein